MGKKTGWIVRLSGISYLIHILRDQGRPRITKKLAAKLDQLRDHKIIKKRWSLLWRWRNIPTLHWRISFFRVQSFLRKEGFLAIQDSFDDAAHMALSNYITLDDFSTFIDSGTMELKFPSREKSTPRNNLSPMASSMNFFQMRTLN